ncbi:GNAT family N-acetyltransferase [Ferdinandcohnia quinoae]|uniref:GNAT family N-acetyltransferase n=1 Tax=Fredinandcohnia quinoae TaxID=2918902 RepID=A0AAW5E8U1_9BACI|nr:GNAT family N-acetyltransferase [Fredinandcohnia sp. SECRCQ15]MCH1627379.1 GNAT family N-acetyltransferase [Fredinandcohnia sp. SECRCQ15]
MIYELNRNDFYKCQTLVIKQGPLEVKAVINGVNPGRIFVDNYISPSSGIVWLGNNDGFLFIGDEENENFNSELNHFIDRVIVPEAKQAQLNWFEGIGYHQKWNKTIERIFTHRQLQKWNQRVYILEEENYSYNNEPILDQGYRLLKLTNKFYENSDNTIKNIDFLHSQISSSWSTPKSFFEKGLGYCIIYNNQIVSLCYSVFVIENIHCVAIETKEDFQERKLAQKVAHHYIKECFKKGILPYWDCMEENKPSIRIAENIGFTNLFNYQGYYFSFEKNK